MKCWGDNVFGQTDVPDGEYVGVSAGGSHSCGLVSDGSVKCWGGTRVLFPSSGTYKSVVSGGTHSCGLLVDGNVKCWGYSQVGATEEPSSQFEVISSGDKGSCGVLREDRAIECWGSNAFREIQDAPSSGSHGAYRQVSMGNEYACALTDDGTITCWGNNAQGQTEPPELSEDSRYVAISSGDTHSCAVVVTDKDTAADTGAVVCWGSNLYGKSDSQIL